MVQDPDYRYVPDLLVGQPKDAKPATLPPGPNGPVGQFTESLGLGRLPFTFWGLVVASVFYSLPFMVQPLQTAFEGIGERPLEVAATLRASPLDAFFSVAVPLARPGFLTASILTFAHTVGEFGVVLMIGGDLPGGIEAPIVSRIDVGADLRPRRGDGIRAGTSPLGRDAGLLFPRPARTLRLAAWHEERRLR